MIHVTAPLQIWRGQDGSSHFLVLPADISLELRAHHALNPRGFGSVRVECTIDPSASSGQAVTWRTSAFPQKSGGYFLPMKIDVCRRAGLAAGDPVTVEIELL